MVPERRTRRTRDPSFASRFLLEELARRHRPSALVICDADGTTVAGITGVEQGNTYVVRPVARAYAEVLADTASQAFAELDSGRGRYDSFGQRLFVSPVYVAQQRYLLVTVGRERAHQAVAAEAIPRLLRILKAA